MQTSQQTQNQYLVGKPIKQTDGGIRLLIKNDIGFYGITVYRGEIRDFLLEDIEWYERMKGERAQHYFNNGRYISMEDFADDYSYNFKTDGDLITSFASKVNLEDQEPILEPELA